MLYRIETYVMQLILFQIFYIEKSSPFLPSFIFALDTGERKRRRGTKVKQSVSTGDFEDSNIKIGI